MAQSRTTHVMLCRRVDEVPDAKREIIATLDRLHAAQEAHDLDGMLAVYGDGYVDASGMRRYFEGLIEADAFRDRTVDLAAAEVFVFRDQALVKPVVYKTPRGPRAFSYHLDRQPDGRWAIIDNNRAHLPGDRMYSERFIRNAGRVVGSRGMVWARRVEAPLERVWETVSTKDGLNRWFLTRNVEIDLRPGGEFKHHWTNTIRDVSEGEFIDFAGVPEDSSFQDYMMRFELKPDGAGTVFSFFDVFTGHPRPLSLPWTASGWHAGMDLFETLFTGETHEHDYGLGGDFYWTYLRDHHALAAHAAALPEAPIGDADWREAYTTPGL
jgi:uncharacterized protein YndB with AHSA1/START domain